MQSYWNIAIILNFVVDLLLLMAANRLAGYPQKMIGICLGAAIGGAYGCICLLPGFSFLANMLWRFVFLGLIGAAAFGCNRNSIHRWILYAFLRMALDGLVQLEGKRDSLSVLLGTAILFGMCVLGFRGKIGQQRFVDVELWRGEKRMELLALHDTGNGLRDPVTGQPVLVADAETAQVLLGLTKTQLQSPVETVEAGIIPGLRLIPYRAVGQASGMLVAIRLRQVRIGQWKGSALVAFAPDGLGEDNTYRALIGGMA